MFTSTLRLLFTAVCATVFSVSAQAAAIAESAWQDAPAVARPAELGDAAVYRSLILDVDGLKRELATAGSKASLSLPRPDGGYATFALSESQTMPPELALRYPQIRSLVGVDAQGHRARIDISPLGLNAMVWGHDGIWVVRPRQLGEGSEYLSLRRADLSAPEQFKCAVHGDVTGADSPVGTGHAVEAQTGAVKRTYRAAIVANHFYTQAVTGNPTPTVADGLAAVVLAINRVNEVYENDLAVHMTLIATNDQLIFPDALTDQFGTANDNDGTNLSAFTSKISGIVGVTNYDIGHVFTTGSGGVAGLGVVCKTTSKGRGTTGLTNGTNLATDIFYIDYVAHEVGHQFGGNHTFNGSNSNCGGGNRSANSAYEPGSGSTIMAYAGICGAVNNLQAHSDPYFHAKSLDEINIYLNNGTGGGLCPATDPNHLAPAITMPAAVTIPARTPYTLTGSATTSAVGAVLSYAWEQYDLGAANNTLAVDLGTGPIARSFNPAASTTRTVPRLSDLLAGTSAIGEILPTTNRTLTFRLTVRDNTAGGGTSDRADVAYTVVDNAGPLTFGPFLVTAPAAALNWTYSGGTGTGTVSWNVANTDQAPVSCPAVNIDLSLDGGYTYPQPLQAAAPNNGNAVVAVPNVFSSQARVRVRCANNVFFNVSPGNFTVTGDDILFQNGFE